tara:strand:- start:4475 stop:5857 length:1383 start_codon:yes stop_codon:yes gene_type:complete
MSSFFSILKEEDETIEGIEDVSAYLNQREEERQRTEGQERETQRLKDRSPEEKRQEQISTGLAEEIGDVVRRVLRNQKILPAYLQKSNKILTLDNDNLRGKHIRKFNLMTRRRGHLPILQKVLEKREGDKTYHKMWLGAIKQAFGYGGLGQETVKTIRRYINQPDDREFTPTNANKIIEMNDTYLDGQEDREFKLYKNDIKKVEDDYEDILTEWEIKVKNIINREEVANDAIERIKLLTISIRRLDEKWDDNKQDRFWNQEGEYKGLKEKIDKALSALKNSVREYKKQIKQQWSQLDSLWDAIQILSGKDGGIEQTWKENQYEWKPQQYSMGGKRFRKPKVSVEDSQDYESEHWPEIDPNNPDRFTGYGGRTVPMPREKTKIPQENKLLHSKGDKKYDFREIDQDTMAKYIEISNQRLTEFIESLGEETPENVSNKEWKTKVQAILDDDLSTKELGEEEE